jgi:hypothetical protein
VPQLSVQELHPHPLLLLDTVLLLLYPFLLLDTLLLLLLLFFFLLLSFEFFFLIRLCLKKNNLSNNIMVHQNYTACRLLFFKTILCIMTCTLFCTSKIELCLLPLLLLLFYPFLSSTRAR